MDGVARSVVARELALGRNPALSAAPGAVIGFVRQHAAQIIQSAGDDVGNLCLVLLRGSLARSVCGPFSDIDLEAFSATDRTLIDRFLHVGDYFVTYYRSSFTDIEDELLYSPVSAWHRGGLPDSIVIFDREDYWLRLLARIDAAHAAAPFNEAAYLPPLRRVLEYRRKILNIEDSERSPYRLYCCQTFVYNFLLFWYTVTGTAIESEATFHDRALRRLTPQACEAIDTCLWSSSDRPRLDEALSTLLSYCVTLLTPP